MDPCPGCGGALEKRKGDFGFFWACAACGRWLINLSLLRRTVEPEFLNGLWQEARSVGDAEGGPCPLCRKAMSSVLRRSGETPLTYFFCKSCLLSWMGPGERAALPVRSIPEPVAAPEAPKDGLSREARQLAARHYVELLGERARREDALEATHLPLWQKILAILGFPIEDRVEGPESPPWGVFLAALVTTGASLYFFTDFTHSLETYGFIPAEFERMGGATFLTCFFVHGGWLHLIGNMYFLVVFGRAVEGLLGTAGFLALLVLATFSGSLLTLWLDPTFDIPHVGASGGIAGVLLFYAFCFPRNRLVFMMAAHIAGPRLIRLPALAVLALWVLVQAVGIFYQKEGMGNVSYSGHLGGLAGGLFGWSFWKWKRSGGWIKTVE